MEKKADTGKEEKKVDPIRFSEWVGANYIRLHAVWVGRYSDQRNKLNWKSTEDLIKLYKHSRDLLNYKFPELCRCNDEKKASMYFIANWCEDCKKHIK